MFSGSRGAWGWGGIEEGGALNNETLGVRKQAWSSAHMRRRGEARVRWSGGRGRWLRGLSSGPYQCLP